MYFSNTVVAAKNLYEYDPLYRLKSAQGREHNSLANLSHNDFANNIIRPEDGQNMRNYTQQYTYDELGNMTEMKSNGVWSRDYRYNFAENNYLLGHDLQSTSDTYLYDEHGNMTKMPHLQELKWDYADNLKEVTLDASGNTAYYVYDASGNRVRKTVAKGNITENRYYVGDYELFTKTTNGTLDTERETLHISDDKQKTALIDYDTQNDATTIRYQLTNHLDSASIELDENADIISYEEYHPFGTTSYRSGRSAAEVSLKRYKYVFKELDNETGLYYYGMRYYAPWVARFVSVDPLQFEYPYYTPFQYAGNKPISFIDLDGAEEAKPELNKVAARNNAIPIILKSHVNYTLKINNRPSSPGINDDGMKKNGKYVGSYFYFAKTDLGQKFLNRFTTGQDTDLSVLKNASKGDMSEHSLVFRMQKQAKLTLYNVPKGPLVIGDKWRGGVQGYTRVGLKVKSSDGYYFVKSLANITAEDVKNSNLKFQFSIVLSTSNTDADDAFVTGHEVFLHAIKYIDTIKAITNKYENKELSSSDCSRIAQELNRLSSERGVDGDNDHYELVNNMTRGQEFRLFLEELKEIVSEEDKHAIQQRFIEELNQYKDIKRKTNR